MPPSPFVSHKTPKKVFFILLAIAQPGRRRILWGASLRRPARHKNESSHLTEEVDAALIYLRYCALSRRFTFSKTRRNDVTVWLWFAVDPPPPTSPPPPMCERNYGSTC